MASSYLIRKATLIHKGHKFHNQKIDVLVRSNSIEKIGNDLSDEADEILEGENLHISAGWVDLRTHLTDPGYEHRDTLETLLNTAASGGFTTVATLPNSLTEVSEKSQVQYLVNKSASHLVDLFPFGKLSDTSNEENLVELYDMADSGAVGFTNGDGAVSNGLLKKALLYTKPFAGLIAVHPADKSIENGGLVNESETTIHTGLKSSPALAEYVRLREQIEVAKYCDAKIHFSCISAKESVVLIKEAKEQGLKVTCDVSIFNLCFTDKEILGFDENFKLYPPLRTEEDQAALIAGINDGTIDAICSNHNPQNIENKMVEFDYADYGALSLQLVLPWYTKFLSKKVSLETFVSCISSKPLQILGKEKGDLQENQSPNLVVFDLTQEWTFDRETNKSLSKNSHEWKQEQTGKVIATFNNNQVKINN